MCFARGVAQPGSALAWGASGRPFKSARPDFGRGTVRRAPAVTLSGHAVTARIDAPIGGCWPGSAVRHVCEPWIVRGRRLGCAGEQAARERGPPLGDKSVQQRMRAGEDAVQHRPRQAAGERVLLARVIRAEQRYAAGQRALGGVAEARARRRHRAARCRPGAQESVQRQTAEADDDAQARRAARARATRNGRQLAISSGVGLLSGGAQRAMALM